MQRRQVNAKAGFHPPLHLSISLSPQDGDSTRVRGRFAAPARACNICHLPSLNGRGFMRRTKGKNANLIAPRKCAFIFPQNLLLFPKSCETEVNNSERRTRDFCTGQYYTEGAQFTSCFAHNLKLRNQHRELGSGEVTIQFLSDMCRISNHCRQGREGSYCRPALANNGNWISRLVLTVAVYPTGAVLLRTYTMKIR